MSTTIARIPLIVVSFLLSLTLWVYVQVQEFPDKPAPPSYTVKVLTVGLPDGMQIVNPPDPIKIFPAGPADDWDRVSESDFTAKVNLSDATKAGVNNYKVRVTYTGDHPGIRWETKPAEVRIGVDKKTTKVIPVRVQVINELPTNLGYWYLPDSTYTEPATITVSGPGGDVSSVESARAILDLQRVTPGGAYTSTLEILQNDGRTAPTTIEYNPKTVLVRPALAVGAESRDLLVQPSYKGQPAIGYVVKSVEITPNVVTVRGRPEALSLLRVLKTKEIDLTDLRESKSFNLTPDLPQDVIVATARPITARITIELAAPQIAPKPTPAKVVPPKEKTRKGR